MMSPQFHGSFNFDLSLYCKSYFGLDINVKVPMVVKEPPEPAPVSDDVYDIPDADEDSLAGAMAQMKGEKVSKKVDLDDDEEDEEEEDFSDIDTDTDADFESDDDEEENDVEKKTK